MLVKPPTNTESKPAWRFLQFFGLENSRESESAKAKNRPTKEPEERKHHFATWYIFAAFLGLMLIQYLWLQYTQIETIPYSQFEQLVDQNKISEVLVGSDTIQGTLKEPFPDGRKLFNTTRVDPELASKLSARRQSYRRAVEQLSFDDPVLGLADPYLLFDLD